MRSGPFCRCQLKFSICNEMFEGWEFGRICEAAKTAGYSGVELAPFTLGKPANEVTASERRALRQAAGDAGVEISSTHWLLAHTTGLHINSRDKCVRDRTVEYLTHLVHLTSDVGAGVMVFGSPKQRSICDGLSLGQAWDFAVESLRALVPVLAERDVIFCLEPLAPSETDFLNNAADTAKLVREIDSPQVQLLLDVKAMSSENRPVEDIIRENASILKHFHANDANMRGPGFGNTDFVPIAGALKDIDYHGWIAVEVFDFRPDPVTIATRSMEYLQCAFS